MNDVTIFSNNTIPDYLRDVGVSDLTKSLMGSTGGGGNKRISLRGKRFRLVVDGEEMATLKQAHLDVVIVHATKDISRTYYSKAYDPKAEIVPPDCWSTDGSVPDVSIASPQASKCDTCPQNIKGSGQGNSRACRFSKRLAVAVVTDGQVENSVYQLTLPAASIFGDGVQNLMPFNKYIKYVGSQGYSIDTLVTTITFDEDSDAPKVYFDARRFLHKEEYQITSKLGKSQEAINAVTFNVAQTDHVHVHAPSLPSMSTTDKSVEVATTEDAEPTVRKTIKGDSSVAAAKPDLSDILTKFAKVSNRDVDDE